MRRTCAAETATEVHRALKVGEVSRVDRRLRPRTTMPWICVNVGPAIESSIDREHEITLRAAGEISGSPSASRLWAGKGIHVGALRGLRRLEVCRESIGWSSSAEYRIPGAGILDPRFWCRPVQ